MQKTFGDSDELRGVFSSDYLHIWAGAGGAAEAIELRWRKSVGACSAIIGLLTPRYDSGRETGTMSDERKRRRVELMNSSNTRTIL